MHAKATGKQSSGKGKQSMSWSMSEGKGKKEEHKGKSKGKSKGTKGAIHGAKGPHKGKTSNTGLSALENSKSETSSETQESAQTCTTDNSSANSKLLRRFLNHSVVPVHVKISCHQVHPKRFVRSQRSHSPSTVWRCHHTDGHERFNQAVRSHLLRYHVRVRSGFLACCGGYGPSTAFPSCWAPVYCGCPARTHGRDLLSRVRLDQSANPVVVWLGLVSRVVRSSWSRGVVEFSYTGVCIPTLFLTFSWKHTFLFFEQKYVFTFLFFFQKGLHVSNSIMYSSHATTHFNLV